VKKKISIAVALITLAFRMQAQVYDPQDVENYIAQYKGIAIEEMHRTGIPASITLAQGIIESGAGKSPLATEANNHFGIKCHEDWKGEGYTYDDDRRNECFRKYDSTVQSFYDHSNFLKTRQRYAVLFTYDSLDYKAWAKGLKSCGYATNPKYADVLIKCIEDYDLHQWDLEDADRSIWFAQMNKTDSDQSSKAAQQVIQRDDAIQASLEKESAEDRIYVFNDIKCVNLPEGESLNELATAYEIGLKRLMRYNDITDASQLQPSDRVYLQPKRNRGDENFHTVKEGETMLSISQDHGIQLQKLYEKNGMLPGSQPAIGAVLNLKEARDTPAKTSGEMDAPPIKMINPPAVSKQFYTVNKGDTLYSISKKYNVSVDQLKQLNELASNDLRVGEKLRVK
jgi:LysM repeat protein